MYRVHITADKEAIGNEPCYRVAVMQPGQSSAHTALLNEHNLQVILYEILSNPTATAVRNHLTKASTRDGDLIELQKLSEQHFNMLRGLPAKAVGR